MLQSSVAVNAADASVSGLNAREANREDKAISFAGCRTQLDPAQQISKGKTNRKNSHADRQSNKELYRQN
jgi:hypothetical protein